MGKRTAIHLATSRSSVAPDPMLIATRAVLSAPAFNFIDPAVTPRRRSRDPRPVIAGPRPERDFVSPVIDWHALAPERCLAGINLVFQRLCHDLRVWRWRRHLRPALLFPSVVTQPCRRRRRSLFDGRYLSDEYARCQVRFPPHRLRRVLMSQTELEEAATTRASSTCCCWPACSAW